jgi:large subunit ribosomal protein L21
MYAVIKAGGKQYRVQPGDILKVEKVDQELGSEFDSSDVLLIGGETVTVGQPVVSNAKVTLVVTKQSRDRKVIIFKKKRRQGYRRFNTHRQPFSELFVKSITFNGKTVKADSEANVIDVEKTRQEKIAQRTTEKEANRGNKEAKAAAVPKKKTAATKKKVTKKKVAKKSTKKKTTKKKK